MSSIIGNVRELLPLLHNRVILRLVRATIGHGAPGELVKIIHNREVLSVKTITTILSTTATAIVLNQ